MFIHKGMNKDGTFIKKKNIILSNVQDMEGYYIT